jgi:hypothetical protein
VSFFIAVLKAFGDVRVDTITIGVSLTTTTGGGASVILGTVMDIVHVGGAISAVEPRKKYVVEGRLNEYRIGTYQSNIVQLNKKCRLRQEGSTNPLTR